MAAIPKVKDVNTKNGIVHVSFTDGHTAVFEPNLRYFQVEGLERFLLKQGDIIVCTFYGANVDRLTKLEEGYTQQQVASYWEAAREYLNKEYFEKPDEKRDEKLRHPWILVCMNSWQYYLQLREDNAQY